MLTRKTVYLEKKLIKKIEHITVDLDLSFSSYVNEVLSKIVM